MNESGAVAPFLPSGQEPVPGSSIVLLVHGFNNDEVEAGDSYMAMREGLNTLLSRCAVDRQTRRRFQSQIWELYWPGYQPLTGVGPAGNRRTKWESGPSALSYCMEVRKARTWVADGLADYLRRHGPLNVFCVAHSLGCRVVTEVLKRLSGRGAKGVQCVGYLLMAAAVPNDKLGFFGELREGARTPKKRYCLHSWQDGVLKYTFGPGQLLAGEVPPWGLPVAAGLGGRPRDLWSEHAATGLGHGGYWGDGLFRDVSVASQVCENMFGLAMPRTLPTASILAMPKTSGLSILPERTLTSAGLRGQNWLRDQFGA